MIDIALIREKPDWVKAQIGKLNDPAALERIDRILEIDKQRRTLIGEGETLQAARNKLNKAYGMLRGSKQIDERMKAAIAAAATIAIEARDFELANGYMSGATIPADVTAGEKPLETLLEAMGRMGAWVEGINEQLKTVDAAFDEEMLWVPNLPHESVPVAENDSFNIPGTVEGLIPEFDFTPKPHWEIAAALDIIDFERGIKLAGSRGYILKGLGAQLQRALITLFLENAREHGFTELYVPNFVREESMFGSGQFPKFRDAVYFDADADVYMLPTAEVAITNMHRDEILDETQLPLYYAAQTPCLRRERMSAGRDVRGIKRVHQFEKVELYKFTSPETSYAELESLVEAASAVIRKLGLPFRRLEIVTGDLGFSATKKYDLEIFAAGSGEWLEVSSCSNTEDFQARRANIKYRPDEGKRTRFVHTLNGSGLATPRVMIAILENYQQADGRVIVPEALRPYMGGLEVIG
ncbi:MAG: serine--tRNA ligase [bacterium]|nr:serine--tRNA ligase [bacterium]